MTQDKKHKKCVQDVNNKVKGTHNCLREYPINRNGDFHFIDIVGHPHPDKKNLKPFAVECESESSKSQQESNRLDLLEWKKHYPEGEISQINDASQMDLNRLKKNKFGGWR